jgi:hypothetical protein
MVKKTSTPESNPWADEPAFSAQEPVVTPPLVQPAVEQYQVEFDLEGLMTDFPTAKELERFVYDQKGIVLNLKGRANKLKYQIAMDALNGRTVGPEFLGGDNPYVDRTEMVPQEELRPVPARDPSLPAADQLQNAFVCRTIPHSDPEYLNTGRKVDCVFRKYQNGMISYEITGPVDIRPHGEKIDKFGRMRPEILKWVDPRTGEQVVVRKDGTLTPIGRNLKSIMQKMPVNKSDQWAVWIDRDYAVSEGAGLNNPWDTASE